MDFTERSQRLNAQLSKETRKENGIYFTPKTIRDKLFAKLKEFHVCPSTILEPSFGSGEFLEDASRVYPFAEIYGVEKHPDLFASVPANPNWVCTDFLEYHANPVDLILGNPPYCVTKQKDPRCMKGRGNVFVQFIYKCLTEHLNPNGVLAFILPTSFYNCGYYEPCRRYVWETTTVLHLETVQGEYYDTEQATTLFIVQKTPSVEKPFFLERGGNLYLSPFYHELAALLKGTKTLSELGFIVKTGEVVWNQEKDKLSDSGTLIVYSSNIVENKLVLGNPGKNKKQYIQGFHATPSESPALVVGRGYGNAQYKFHFAEVQSGIRFYGENHVNVITRKLDAKISLKEVAQSFANEKTREFLRMFIGNSALSKTELECVLPIFVN